MTDVVPSCKEKKLFPRWTFDGFYFLKSHQKRQKASHPCLLTIMSLMKTDALTSLRGKTHPLEEHQAARSVVKLADHDVM